MKIPNTRRNSKGKTGSKTINDTEKRKKFSEVLKDSIKSNDYVSAFNVLLEAKEYVNAELLKKRSYNKLESDFNKALNKKLKELGFVDVSGKILSTTFWAVKSSGNLALKGPPGVGKSFFSKVVLPELWVLNGKKPKVITVQPDRNMDISSLVADRGLKKGDTIVEKGQIADAVNVANQGRRIILILEEINQWPPKVLKDLNDFLEERKLERKIAGKAINLACDKDKLFIIANYNPEGYTLGEDETGSVSSRFVFCDLPFPSKKDLENIIKVNISDEEYKMTSIGDEIKRVPNKSFLRSMSDICYSIRSSIDSGELGPLAMPIGTRNIINFSRALIENNSISDAVEKFLIDPVLEKYVREGTLTNIEPKTYEEYVRTIFKAVKQILGSIKAVDEKNLKSLKNGLDTSISDLFSEKGKNAYRIRIRKSKKMHQKPKVEKLIKPAKKILKEETKKGPIKEKPRKEKNKEENIEKKEVSIEISNTEPILKKKTKSKEIKKYDKPTKESSPKIRKSKPKEAKKEKSSPYKISCPICKNSLSLVKDARGRRTLICDNDKCRNVLLLPQYGEIEVSAIKCKLCRNNILEINRNNRVYHICPVCWRKPEINGPCESCIHKSECF
ncbi:MAG: AAA domain-containing protein [Candidatus Lokiarchaeota archaeon]|nr:AAA domain-containing protein [Candidatus Lokiarchaeota archaeon]